MRSFLNIFLPEDEYKRLRILYFMSEAAFLAGGVLIIGSAVNNYLLRWNLEAPEVTLLLMMTAVSMAVYTYFRYIFSGIEHTEVSSKQDYKKERRTAGMRALSVGAVFFIIHLVVKGMPANNNEWLDIIALPLLFTIFYFLFDLISLKRSTKKNRELDD